MLLILKKLFPNVEFEAAVVGFVCFARLDPNLILFFSNSSDVSDSAALPFTSFDHSKAHFYRYDEQVSLCLERLR